MKFIIIMFFAASSSMGAGVTSTSFEATFDSYEHCIEVASVAAKNIRDDYTTKVECILKDSASEE